MAIIVTCRLDKPRCNESGAVFLSAIPDSFLNHNFICFITVAFTATLNIIPHFPALKHGFMQRYTILNRISTKYAYIHKNTHDLVRITGALMYMVIV